MAAQELELHNQTLSQLDQGHDFSTKFKNTFGFSHGVGHPTNGGVMVAGAKKKMLRGR